MKKKKYLSLYKRWMQTGRINGRANAITSGGLCSSEIGLCDDLELFTPTEKDDTIWMGYWGYDDHAGNFQPDFQLRQYEFTPLRQTIVLFLAALNGEL